MLMRNYGWGRQHLEIELAVDWDSLGSNYRVLVCLFSLFFKASLHQRFTTRQNTCRESCSRVHWSAQLKSADAVAYRHYGHQRPTANQLVAQSPVAKKHRVEQPIGTRTLWNDWWLTENCFSQSSFSEAWIQSHGEVQIFFRPPELQYAKWSWWNFCLMTPE